MIEDDCLTVIVLGHGGGVPMGDFGNTNYALVSGEPSSNNVEEILRNNPYWLVDCGPETIQRIAGTGNVPEAMIQNLQGVILTHCHGDHSGGLAALAWRTKFVEQKQVKLVYREELIPFLEGQLIETRFLSDKQVAWTHYWETMAYSASRDSMDLGPFSVKLFEVDHNIPGFPSFGVEVVLKSGTTVVISGDTAVPVDAERIAAADVVFHDTQFYSDDPVTSVHCPYKLLEAAVPEDERYAVYLTHTGKPPAEALLAGFKWGHQDLIETVS